MNTMELPSTNETKYIEPSNVNIITLGQVADYIEEFRKKDNKINKFDDILKKNYIKLTYLICNSY